MHDQKLREIPGLVAHWDMTVQELPNGEMVLPEANGKPEFMGYLAPGVDAGAQSKQGEPVAVPSANELLFGEALSLDFDNQDVFVVKGNETLDSLNKDFSISFWARFYPSEDTHFVLSNGEEGFRFGFKYSRAYLTLHDYKRENPMQLSKGFDDMQDLLDNMWMHIAWTVSEDGKTHKIYVNGEYQSEVKLGSAIPLIGGDFIIGGSEHGVEEYRQLFNGDVDEIRIYDRQLTEEEIKLLAIY